MSTDILAVLARIEAKIDAMKPIEADIGGQYGDPEVRKDPKFWTGPSMVGKTYSQCPPAFLESLASMLDWKAEKELEDPDPERSKWAPRSRKDAARARAWAERIRSKPEQAAATPQAQPAASSQRFF
jgi:hypothetical protein